MTRLANQDLLKASLDYAARGIPVFPCDANKKPLTKHGFKDASTDAAQITRWWTKWPGALIAMPTGKASGIDVLDLDNKKGKNGFEAVPEWKTLSLVTVTTPSGGVHLYFKASGTSTTRDTIALGVDTRGDGGYACVPPSPGYQWRNGQDFATLRPFPKRLAPSKPSRNAEPALPDWMEQWCRDNPDEMRAHQRWVVGMLDDPKVTVDEVKAALAVIPADCSEEVWWKVAAALYDELGDEGFTIFHGWSATGGASYTGERDCRKKWTASAKKTGIHIGTLFYYANQHDPGWRQRIEVKAEEPATIEQQEQKAVPASSTRVSPIQLFWPGEEAADETRWRVKGLIPEVGIGILAARRGVGKTFVAISLSYALARLKTFIHKPIVGNVGTLWIAREAPWQVPLRLRGLPEEPGCWPFRYVKTCPPLLDTKGRTNSKTVDDIVAAINIANDEMIERFEMPIGFVPIDTMRRAAGYGDRGENDPSITGNVMTAFSDIAEATNTFVLGIDHMGHDTSRGARGGTSKEDDADLVLYLDGEHGQGVMVVEKVRDGVDSIAAEFKCVVVELGTDLDGDPVTTCRVDWGELSQVAPKETKRSAAEKLFQAAIDKAELPTTADALREAHKAVYLEARKTKEHEQKEWSVQTKSQTLRFYDEGGVQMVRRRF